MIVIGVTGKICSGKNRYAAAFAACGAQTVDVDTLGHEVLSSKAKAVAAVFGLELQADGTIDRKALGEIVFSDPLALKQLEEILHPAMVERIKGLIDASDAPLFVINAALLERMRLVDLCDRVVYIQTATLLRYIRCRRRSLLSIREFLARNRAQRDIRSDTLERRVDTTVLRNYRSQAIIHRQVAQYCARIEQELLPSG
ncbi:MAG TPA: dephospho-CoA kinase [Sphaerochaeta sp.]|nr:dephospho-CoA kinase [Sphaerochaeta sp.]